MKRQAEDTLNSHISVGEIYEGGALNGITIAELVGNEVAIRQVVNEVNAKNAQVKQLSQELSRVMDEKAELKAKTTMRWYEVTFNASGAVVLAIGTNIRASNVTAAIALIVVGAMCVIASNLVGVFRSK